MTSWTIIAEYARSHRSTCKTCMKQINLGQLRIGRMPQNAEGEQKHFPSYYHLNCWYIPKNMTIEHIKGLNKLSANDVKRIENYMKDEKNRVGSGRKEQDVNEIRCHCGEKPVEKITKKEGPNQGRRFYSCPTNKCKYFQWIDYIKESIPSPPSPQKIYPTSPTGEESNSRENAPTSPKALEQVDANAIQQAVEHEEHGEQLVHCQCNLPAVERVTKKEGPNQGRRFFVCPKSSVERCNFFKWIDPPNLENIHVHQEGKEMKDVTTQTTPPSSPIREEKKREESPKKEEEKVENIETKEEGIYCFCKKPATKRIVKKQNANQGREFYGCPELKCNFFKWSNNVPSPKKASKRARENDEQELPKAKQAKITDYV